MAFKLVITIDSFSRILHKCQDFHLFEQQTPLSWKYLNYDEL